MRLLITRPKDDATAFAATLKTLGHEVVVAPLMQVEIHEGPPLALGGMQGVIATSANGVRAFALRSDKRDIPLYAVGPQTAEAATQAGFQFVYSAEGDAAALAEAVSGWAKPDKGGLLHAAGAETAGRLRQALQAKGFAVTVETLYEAIPVAELPQNLSDALRADSLDAALLFSPRSAKLFAGLVTKAGLTESCARLQCFCISAATASALGDLTFRQVSVAGAPNQEAMLALVTPPQ
jgi:uroporphyrinogen-III synthase